MRGSHVGLCLACALLGAPLGLRAGEEPGAEFFERQVRPLLVERCQKCHGPEKPKAGLRLTSRAAILQGGESGPAAVPGNPDESLMIQAVRYADEPKMPPKEKLPDHQVAALARWVALGLPWPEHESEAKPPAQAPAGRAPASFTEAQRQFWSFQPVRAPALPAVADAAWCRTPIDRFLLAALEQKGLKPAPPADKRTLIRRATFDLIGLPPTPEEVHAFLADRSPEAFARVVERLLASPRYGERWGRHWLDVVRYADSRDTRDLGQPTDITEAYRYRDWVARAFNRDMPYDQFIIEQLAGDVLPGPGPGGFNAEGLVATGLLAIGEWGTGDADKEKMVTDIVDDQIDVVGRAFLGLTLACARCHDHKFDPIPTDDYYGLAGIFFSTHILPEPGLKTAGSPLLRTPIAPPSVVKAASRHKARLALLEKQLQTVTDAQSAAYAQTQLARTAAYLIAAWQLHHPARSAAPPLVAALAEARKLNPAVLSQWSDYLGRAPGRHMNQPVRNVLGKSGVHAWRGAADCPSLTVNTRADVVALLTFKLAPRSVAVHPGPRAGVAVAWQSPVSGTVSITGLLADADPAGGDGVSWSLALRSQAEHTLCSGSFANAGSQRFAEGKDAERLAAVTVAPGDWIVLSVLPKANHTCDTTRVELKIALCDGAAHWDLTRDLVADPLAAGLGNPHADGSGHPAVWHFLDLESNLKARAARHPLLARWQETAAAVQAGKEPPEAIERLAHAIQAAVEQGPDTGPGGRLRAELLSKEGPLWLAPALLPPEARGEITRIERERDALGNNPPPPIPVALAAQEGGVPRTGYEGFGDARIHIRGSYQRLGAKVPRHFPRILAGNDQPPITQGSGRLELARWIARPEHPLTARVMVNRIWQHHFGAALVRTPSNFGRLGERPTHPELLDYLAGRFVTYGWSIKAMHRAIMLSAVYQQSSATTPEALRLDPDNRLLSRANRRRLEAEPLRDSLLAVSGRLEDTMGGPAFRDLAAPRRTVYLMAMRSDRSSYGPLFDAADPTAIVDLRTESTVAPQALFLLNHPFVLEQARALANRVLHFQAASDRARIEQLYELLLARLPGAEELALGLEALAAGAAGGEGRERAWTAYCQILLCSNEFYYVD